MVCPNCNYLETTDAKYCSSCGQTFGANKPTVREFFRDFFDHVLSLDSSFFRTLKKIWIPGQLTIDYFNGLRKRYYHPLRLFFFLLVIHLGVLGGLIPYDRIFEEINNQTNDILTRQKIRTELARHAESGQSRVSRMALDSLMSWFDIDTASAPRPDTPGTRRISILGFQNLDPEDVVLLPVDSIVAKYKISSFWTKLMVGQAKKFTLDPKGMVRFIIGNISWMMIVMIPILALFMKVQFLRGKRYLIEHLFFLYHWHAFSFLIVSLLVLLFRNFIETAWLPVMVAVILYGLIAWIRYYRQGIFWSVLKFFTLGVAYLILFSFFIFFTALISFGFY